MSAEIVMAPAHPGEIIIAVALSNARNEHLQVLFPANSIFDLPKFERESAARWTRIETPSRITLADRYASLSLSDAPTLVDSALAAQSHWCAPTEQGLLRMPSAEWRQVLNLESVQSLATPVADISQPIQTPEQLNLRVHHLTGRRVQRTLADTIDLPALPQTAADVIRLKLNPDAGLDELAEIIGRDPSIAAQVVSWANSAFYATPGGIKSVSDAIIRVLGYDMVMNLALGLSLGRVLKAPTYLNRSYSFWEQSVLVAGCMQRLAQQLPPSQRPNLGEAYLCGLLHNFGDIILAHLFEHLQHQIDRTQAANPHLPSWFVDHHLLGLAREDIGAELLAGWQIPDEVCRAIQMQHRPDIENPLSGLLYLSLRHLQTQGLWLDAPGQVDAEQYAAFDLDAQHVDKVIASVLADADSLLGLARTLDA